MSVIALVVAVIAIRYQLQRKILSVFTSRDRYVFHVFDHDLASRLVMTLDGQPVGRLYSTRVIFRNLGNVPISPGDFVEPIRISFCQPFRVLSSSVGRATDCGSSVKVATLEDKNSSQIAPLLLNAGDWFTLEFLLDGPPDWTDHAGIAAPDIFARIAGAKLTHELEPRPKVERSIWWFRFSYSWPWILLGALLSFAFSWSFEALMRFVGAR